jgi:hypothetical protein
MRNRTTQKDIILNVLREKQDWIVSHQLEKVSTKWGWLGTSALKRCRELEVEKKIEKKIEEGYVWYRGFAPRLITEYRTPDGTLVSVKREYA